MRRCEVCREDLHWVQDAREAQRYAEAGFRVGGEPEVAREIAREGLRRLQAGQPEGARPACFTPGERPEPSQSPFPYCRCVTDEGVYDMHGNLHEWVADSSGVFRGGFYVDASINGTGCSYRTTRHTFDYHDYSTGFRCCADAE